MIIEEVREEEFLQYGNQAVSSQNSSCGNSAGPRNAAPNTSKSYTEQSASKARSSRARKKNAGNKKVLGEADCDTEPSARPRTRSRTKSREKENSDSQSVLQSTCDSTVSEGHSEQDRAAMTKARQLPKGKMPQAVNGRQGQRTNSQAQCPPAQGKASKGRSVKKVPDTDQAEARLPGNSNQEAHQGKVLVSDSPGHPVVSSQGVCDLTSCSVVLDQAIQEELLVEWDIPNTDTSCVPGTQTNRPTESRDTQEESEEVDEDIVPPSDHQQDRHKTSPRRGKKRKEQESGASVDETRVEPEWEEIEDFDLFIEESQQRVQQPQKIVGSTNAKTKPKPTASHTSSDASSAKPATAIKKPSTGAIGSKQASAGKKEPKIFKSRTQSQPCRDNVMLSPIAAEAQHVYDFSSEAHQDSHFGLNNECSKGKHVSAKEESRNEDKTVGISRTPSGKVSGKNSNKSKTGKELSSLGIHLQTASFYGINSGKNKQVLN